MSGSFPKFLKNNLEFRKFTSLKYQTGPISDLKTDIMDNLTFGLVFVPDHVYRYTE